MSQENNTTSVENEIRDQLQSAGPRTEIPAADLAAIRSAAREAWEESVERDSTAGKQPVYGRYLAIAAAALIALFAGWWVLLRPQGPGPTPTEIVATVTRVTDAIWLDDNRLALGDEIPAGSTLRLESYANPAAVRLAGGQSLRLDAETRVRLVSATQLELLEGTLYVDSAAPEGSLEILASALTVREIGTQYEIRLDEETNTLRVRVREGLVRIKDTFADEEAKAGDEVTISADGSVSRSTVDRDGTEWLWVLEAAPVMEIEGESLAAFLIWVGRETGWEIRYEDHALEQEAATIELHGSIEDLRPDQSAEVVLRGSGLDYRFESGALVVIRTPR